MLRQEEQKTPTSNPHESRNSIQSPAMETPKELFTKLDRLILNFLNKTNVKFKSL